MTEPVSWTPALIALAIGAVLGAIALFRARNAGAARVTPSEESLALRDLEGERDSLIAQLRELDDLATTRSAEQLAAERAELEIRAAEVLRELDQQAASVSPLAAGRTAPAASEEAEVAAARSPWAGFAWGIVAVVAVALIVVWVDRSAQPKPEAMTQQASAATMVPPDLAALEMAVNAQPENDDLRLDYARALLVNEQLMEVYRQTQHVLQRRPGDARALTYQSMVHLAMGQPEQALTMLNQATQADPQLLDAWVHTAFVYSTLGDTAQADAAMKEAIRRHPEQRAALEDLAKRIVSGRQG